MSRILCIGVATQDVLLRVAHYPAEDAEVRALARSRRPGGNAANSAQVLAQFRHEVELLAALARDDDGDWLGQTLAVAGVGFRYCPRLPGATPTSFITLAADRATRTIVHHRELPEIARQALDGVPLEVFDWFHCEGRNVTETRAMLEHIRSIRIDQGISLELEKPRADIETLLPLADVLLYSRDYAVAQGHTDPTHFLAAQQASYPHAALQTVAWGAAGAYGIEPDGTLHHQPAAPAGPAIDTLGAGDTYNAGVIHALVSGRTPREAIAYGVRLAGCKVAQAGFANLARQAPL
ncbi:MAG: PfkB family carbohydrate kinase [Thiotrichales bacterium]